MNVWVAVVRLNDGFLGDFLDSHPAEWAHLGGRVAP